MNIDYRLFIVYALATWRLASLFVQEDGPFDIFYHIRVWAGIVHDDNGQPSIIPDKFFSKLLSCVWCFSMWAGIFFAVGLFLLPNVFNWIAFPLALSAISVAVDKGLSK